MPAFKSVSCESVSLCTKAYVWPTIFSIEYRVLINDPPQLTHVLTDFQALSLTPHPSEGRFHHYGKCFPNVLVSR